MVREILEFLWGIIKSRYFILVAVFALLFSAIVVRNFNLQIVNHENYLDSYEQRMEKTLSINSTRGLIYDSKGNVLAYNELTYSVQITDTIDSSNMKNEQLNSILYNTINIIEKYGDEIIDNFPLVYNSSGVIAYSSSLSENSRLRFLKNAYGTETLDTETRRLSDTTAYQAYVYLRDTKYEVDTELYEEEMIRKIIMLRYNLSLNTYQKYKATTIAQNVSTETMAAIYENEDIIPGVVIAEDTIRRYNDALYFAHIIGYTGTITEDEMVSLNAAGGSYEQNDTVGKTGIEQTYETTLSGTKGEQTVLVNSLGKVLSVLDYVDSTAGSDVYLTIDSDLQKAAYHQLEQKIAGILLTYIKNTTSLTEEEEEDNCILIRDVYYQLLNNNVVSVDRLSLDSATDNEKNIYNTYKSRYNSIAETIRETLYDISNEPLKSLSDEWNEYYTYIYQKLALSSYGLEVIMRDEIDTDDEVYQDWMADEISLREFLLYCVSMNWIDLTKLDIDSVYSDSGVIYDALVDYIMNTLAGDTTFDKIIYKYLVTRGTIRGNSICMALYDQGVLEMDEAIYQRLSRSNAYAYEFIINQITDLKITPAQLALQPCSGSVVVTDPNTGNVLAMVSYPSYDNNLFSGSINYEDWTALSTDLSTPLYNRATKARTAPGSTFKMLSAIAGIEESVITPNTTIVARGIYENELLTNTPRCWYYPRSHGAINVRTAIEESCNYFFYEVGFRLGTYANGSFSHDYGLSRLKQYATMFGLTEKSGVEVDEYMPLFSTSDTVMSAIGQGAHSFTPVQLARYVSTIANDGYNYSLTLIDKVVENDGSEIENNVNQDVQKNEIAELTMNTVRQGMRMVVTDHYPSIFRNVEFSIAGKTGTAQESTTSASHSLFIAYAPYEEPEVAISVAIPNGHKSSYSAELARNVLRYYFGYVPMDSILSGKADLPNSSINSAD